MVTIANFLCCWWWWWSSGIPLVGRCAALAEFGNGSRSLRGVAKVAKVANGGGKGPRRTELHVAPCKKREVAKVANKIH